MMSDMMMMVTMAMIIASNKKTTKLMTINVY